MTRWALVFAGLALAAGQAPVALAEAPTQLQIAAHAAVKIEVTRDGWHRVTQPQLVAAGLPRDARAGALRLFADGVERALTLTGNGDDVLDAGEAIEFYGQGRDTLWTGVRTYWLTFDDASGARVSYASYPRGVAPPPSFRTAATVRERKMYYAPLLNGDESNFLGATIDGQGVAQTLTVGALADSTTAVLRVTLQGVSAGTHAVAVALGDAALGTCTLTNQARTTCALAAPLVAEGANAVRLTSMGMSPDIVLLESIELSYDHAFAADGDRLTFTTHPRTRVAITRFSTPSVRVVDVTDARAPIELVVSPSPAGSETSGPWTVAFDVPDGDADRSLIAFTDADVLAPAAVTAARPSDWMQPRTGELVILSHERFIEAARALARRREAQGWSVALVDLQDVYDEFGAGDKSAFAIREFLRGATARWTVPPRHVLLVGDATFDPRNFTGMGDFDLVPTKLVDARDMETSSDDWFVDADDDGLPDLAIGRLPVRTAAQARALVDKILAYAGTDELARGGLFVTDQPAGGLDFQAASGASAAAVADRMPVETYARSSGAAGLLTKLGRGPFLVNYFGHGSVEVWEGLLDSKDAPALANEHLSIYVAMNCLNGFFHDLYTTSLAEALLLAPHGAVAVWASSTLTPFPPQAALDLAFLERLTSMSLGEAALEAKRVVTDVDVRRTWMLFGDPTLFGTPVAYRDGGAPEARGADGGGTDAGLDGAPGPDAGEGPGGSGGCSCQAASGGVGAPGLLLLIAALTWRRGLSRRCYTRSRAAHDTNGGLGRERDDPHQIGVVLRLCPGRGPGPRRAA